MTDGGNSLVTGYRFKEIKVGETKMIPAPDKKAVLRIRAAAGMYAQRNGWRFVTRATENGLLIWRIS
ncbi:MAG: hypothetical protein KGL39_07740 [Patescibacteria group bacterium]|nr:hypothetical protein [Patescibacteria group bacterium]